MNSRGGQKRLVYQVHVFCCINQRQPGHSRGSCSARGSQDLHKYMKARAKELRIGGIRVNKAGCLERCELGPVMVIYPEAVWYHYNTREDVDEILERHILGGDTVDRLILDADQKFPETNAEPRLRLKVRSLERLTAEIRKFELVAEDGGELPVFTAGGHIDIITGNGLRRSFSLANDPQERRRYIIAVLREKAGRGGSAWLHGNVAVGDILEAAAPRNDFPLDEGASRHMLIAGGIGITPLLAMGRRLRSLGAPATLHYCTRGPETTAFGAEVREVFGDRVVFYHDGGDPSRGIDLEKVLAGPAKGACLYICGPSDLIDAARRAAGHWPEGAVRFERFTAAPRDETGRENTPFDIVLSRRGKTLIVPAGKSILQVVREAGVFVGSFCEEGNCGTCRVRLLGGRADHRDCFLSAEDKARHKAIMICSSRAEPGETLILDI